MILNIFILVFANFVISSTTGGIVLASYPLETVRLLRRSVRSSETSDNFVENPNQCFCIHSKCKCCFYQK
ncbi:hypothetical protein HNY73_013881 [Argiope bruennichi]|uniref:Uncharacterized protein n=1 Tax=Argiope bruennichi TaxID=94029 RepID=A0A8T0EMI7_ARGBR|nr:hypothetical protein HNY73_013881 [Argiope bruennichi]